MVEHQDRLDAVFKALADPTRRAMLADLRTGERTISDLAAPHDMSLAGASKHIGVLERAGLVTRRKAGREHHCRLQPDALKAAETWLQSYADFWNERLDRLNALLTEEKDNG